VITTLLEKGLTENDAMKNLSRKAARSTGATVAGQRLRLNACVQEGKFMVKINRFSICSEAAFP